MSTLSGVVAVAKTKAAASLAVATLATGTAVAAAAPSSTHSSDGSQQSNAQAFGHNVVAQIASCKAALGSGDHGIGRCLSAWVKANNPGAKHRHDSSAAASLTEGKSGDAHGQGANHHSPNASPSPEGQSDSTSHGQSTSPGKSSGHTP
jgi:hypothetical protein